MLLDMVSITPLLSVAVHVYTPLSSRLTEATDNRRVLEVWATVDRVWEPLLHVIELSSELGFTEHVRVKLAPWTSTRGSGVRGTISRPSGGGGTVIAID